MGVRLASIRERFVGIGLRLAVGFQHHAKKNMIKEDIQGASRQDPDE